MYDTLHACGLAVDDAVSKNRICPCLLLSCMVNYDCIKVSEKESTAYFQSRPRGSQVGAWALHQSRPVESRMSLEANVKDVQVHFSNRIFTCIRSK